MISVNSPKSGDTSEQKKIGDGNYQAWIWNPRGMHSAKGGGEGRKKKEKEARKQKEEARQAERDRGGSLTRGQGGWALW